MFRFVYKLVYWGRILVLNRFKSLISFKSKCSFISYMKILAFCDLHEDYEYAEELMEKAKDVDLILCAGDITVFGDSLDVAVNFLDGFGKKVICVHGNHESEHKMKKLCEKSKNVVFVHEKGFVFEDVLIIGYGGGGFVREDENFEKIINGLGNLVGNFDRSILLTHAPPYFTRIDEIEEDYHVGNRSIRKFIEKYQPSVAVSGHIHEAFRRTDRIKKTIVVNPGPRGAVIHM